MPSAGSVRRAHRTLSAAAAGAAIDAYDREGLIDDQEGGSRRSADQSFRRDIARGSSRDGFLGVLLHRRSSRSISLTTAQFVLLAASGLLTAAPFLFFGAVAKRLPVVTMGLLQYITPILQLLWAVLVRHEILTVTTWVGFGMVWCALLLFSADAIRHKRKALPPRER
jgi:hypothetical protein